VPQRRVKGHLLTTEPVGIRLRHGIHTNRGGIGPFSDGGLLAGGTRDEGDQGAEVRPAVIGSIRRWLGEILPAARGIAVRHSWSCLRPTSADGRPVIDRIPGLDNAWVAAGHGGEGLLLAPATGQALADWVTTGDRPVSMAAFALARFT
jgi:glycine/D-amino acid oxidase-like deaminating enzyme